MDKKAFETVDIREFFGASTVENKTPLGIVVFTEKQQRLVNHLRQSLSANNPEQLEIVNDKIENLRDLAAAIATFPSLLERTHLTFGTRTPQSLMDSLINSKREGDMTLQLPSKASLGKGFLVTKLHIFAKFERLARDARIEEKIVNEFHSETVYMMFLLLAEDVYLNLIRDTSLPMDSRRQLANSLLLLWEHRADQNISDISPVLQSVWKARATLAPAFGTMMGTSELIMISFQLDERWSEFIRTRLADKDVSQSMEEFLFGLSFEQISRLKEILRERGISAIGRKEVSSYLGEEVPANLSEDYRDFFQQYSVRRDNARARRRLGVSGPKKTLEDHFINFIMDKNAEKQKNDSVAK